MKTIILGDTHGKSFWKLILNTQEYDRVIYLGDYFDSFDISGVEQLHNLKEIIELKVRSKKEVILLLGNHDLGYMNVSIKQSSVAGYQPKMYHQFYQLLNDNADLFQMAYGMNNYLFTHAGVSEEWLSNNGWENKEYTVANIVEFVNEQWKYKPKSFEFDGYDSYGNDTSQTPIWIRPSSLIDASKNIKNQGIIQVVGHTKVYKLEIEDERLKGYILTDTFDTSQEYLIIDEDKLIINKI